jgi:cytosine/adenosine deaminase-related metal-dependent hydrolase
MHNPYSQVIYALGGRAVRDVIINGAVVLKNHKLIRLDEAELINTAKKYKAIIDKELKQ